MIYILCILIGVIIGLFISEFEIYGIIKEDLKKED